VDHNNLQGFGSTHAVASMSPLVDKIAGFNVDVHCVNGHDINAIRTILDSPTDKCRVVILETAKGNGVSFMENRMEWHYLPLNKDQYHQAIQEIEAA